MQEAAQGVGEMAQGAYDYMAGTAGMVGARAEGYYDQARAAVSEFNLTGGHDPAADAASRAEAEQAVDSDYANYQAARARRDAGSQEMQHGAGL